MRGHWNKTLIRVALFVPAILVVSTTAPAASTTYATFESFSEGCSGGGDVCGTFPLIPSGSAEYDHSTASDGTLDILARTEGGLPVAGCFPAACPVGKYHAEAHGAVWVDVDTPPGVTAVAIRADYVLDELEQTQSPTIGSTEAVLLGSIGVTASPDGPVPGCSDSSAIVGVRDELVDATSPTGPGALETTLTCSGAGTLMAATWRIALSMEVGATTDGGTASASGVAQLVSVDVEVLT